MKKIVVVILFVLTIFSIDRIGGWVMNELLSRSQFRYARMYKGEAKADIVIIGNSRGVNGFYTPYLEKELGKDMANISYNGLKTDLVVALLDDYLEIYHPKLVVIEGSFLFNSPRDTALLKDFKLYTSSSSRIEKLLSEQAEKDNIAANIFHLYRYNTTFFYRNLYYMSKSDKTWINNYKLSSKLVELTKKIPDVEIEVNKESLEILKAFQKRNSGVEIRVAITPYLPVYKEKMEGFETALKQINEELYLEAYDYSDALESETFFGDRVHSNKKGAIELGKMMVEDGIFDYD